MLYIFEGPRNSGKTTLVQSVQEAFGENAYIIKFQRTTRPSPPVFMADFLAKNYLALIDSRSICLLDRFHLTEFVMRSLDQKVDQELLFTTTHMIDHMLKAIGAVTFVLETSVSLRNERLKRRDIDHQKKEWPDYKELDGMWTLAKKTFSYSEIRTVKHETIDDTARIVADILNHARGGKLLSEKIPFYPPIVQVSADLVEV